MKYHVQSRTIMGAVALLGCAATGAAQSYYSDFESGYTAGADVNGTNGWYLPTTAGSVTGIVVSYASNALNIAGGSRTGTKGIGNTNPGGTSNTRMQRDFGFVGTRSYTMHWDSTVRFNGTLPGTQNVGSISLQDSLTTRFFIALMVWTDPTLCDSWAQQYNVVDGAGTALNNQSPGAAWTALALNHWYRNSVTWNFNTNQIESVSILDLSTGAFSSFAPAAWYLTGGTTPTLPVPTAVRYFVGGTTAGNTVGYDNILVAPKALALDTASVSQGLAFGGSITSLTNEDNDRMVVLNDENDPNGAIDVSATASTGTASSMVVWLVSSSSRTDVGTYLKLKNQTTNAYTQIGFQVTKTTNQDLVGVPATPGAFVNATTNKINARIEWIPTADIDAGDGWTVAVDEFKIHVTP